MNTRKTRNITIYTDASHCPDKRVAGLAFWARDDEKKLQHSRHLLDVSNAHEAEIFALVWAVLYVKRVFIFDGARLILTSDCIGALEFLRTGRTTVTERARKAKQQFDAATVGLDLRFNHVKGHTGGKDRRSYVNRLCDQQARARMREGRALV